VGKVIKLFFTVILFPKVLRKVIPMKVKVEGKTLDIRAVWLENADRGIVKMIDQRKLPWKFEIFTSQTYLDTAMAIKEMIVRGAPTIGATAAYGVYQAAIETLESKDFIQALKEKIEILRKTRPTAVNLFNATEEMLQEAIKLHNEKRKKQEIKYELMKKAEAIANREVEANKKIGEFGAKLIQDNSGVLTHCNAGALAAVDIGTALAPIRTAYYEGKKFVVYVDETRPWLQGARLTAWELEMEEIPYYLISDNAAGFFIWKGEINIVIVGADRIALNGDVANKIGTYKLAVIAKENGIPFYVAAPLSTFDRQLDSGEKIPIEERSGDEIIYVRGIDKDNKMNRVRIAPKKTKTRNPVFDITPSKYISGIITEVGILRGSADMRKVLRGQ